MLLEFRDNKTLHNDLILHFNGLEIESDSYYFALDRNVKPENEDADKIKIVIKRLLEQWKSYVSRAKSDEVIYLPFDFSGEYTGCIKCEFQNTDVLLTIGYLDFQGWSFFPSEISEYVQSSRFFIKSKDFTLKLKKSDFLQQIKENIQTID